jgi:RNA polymerase sigma-70 factor (ECF subfamily)
VSAEPSDPLGELYRAHRDSLWNAALHLLGDAAAAEDVLHDVFAGLVQRPLPAMASARAFLLGSVLNCVRDRARRRGPQLSEALDGQAGVEPRPELLAVAGEHAALVAAALASLPLEQREVVVLHVFEGMSFREVGAAAGVSQDTAASRWRYACEKLKRALTAKGVQP